jgi:glycosyltransferase involved in cell wall biosynthesis
MRNELRRFPESFEELVRFIRAQPNRSELVYVDDGSDDGTPRLVEEFVRRHPSDPIRLIERQAAGKGAAVQAGLATATTEIAAFCDVDLATPLHDLGRIIDAATGAPILAIGSRDLATSTVTRHESSVRETLGRIYNRAVQFTVAPGIADTQCGAKAARTDVWKRILPHCRESGFAWDVEAVAVASALGIDVHEIGIEWCHQHGSRIRPVADGIAMARALPRIRRNLLAGQRNGTLAAEQITTTGALTAVGNRPGRVNSWARRTTTLVSSLMRIR